MGFIENNKAMCMLSVLINTHMLQASLRLVSLVSFIHHQHVCMLQINNLRQIIRIEGGRYPHHQKVDMDGKKFFTSGCANILGRTLD